MDTEHSKMQPVKATHETLLWLSLRWEQQRAFTSRNMGSRMLIQGPEATSLCKELQGKHSNELRVETAEDLMQLLFVETGPSGDYYLSRKAERSSMILGLIMLFQGSFWRNMSLWELQIAELHRWQKIEWRDWGQSFFSCVIRFHAPITGRWEHLQL